MSDAPVKVSLLEMVLLAEQEKERIDTWERVLNKEGSELDETMVRRRLVYGRMTQTLELVIKHELEFVQMVNARREAERREKRAKEPDAA